MKSVDQHVAQCLAAVAPLTPLRVGLLDALGLVLAERVTAEIDLPPFDNSAMDGYAVRPADLVGAGPDHPVVLPVQADLFAGIADPGVLAPGSVARIMTGAPVPRGTEAIVPVEWTDGAVDRVAVRGVPEVGRHVRHAGDDVRAGAVLSDVGDRLGPRQLALLAAAGRAAVLVSPRPRVVVLSTGSEVVPPGTRLAPGRVYDAGGYGLVAAARQAGAEARHGGIVPDDSVAVRAALVEAAAEADLVVTSGGVSAGAYDTVKEVLLAVGGVTFDAVAMQPGMPQGFGRVGARGVPIFTLPGNPVSSLVSFEVFVRPVLRRMAGERDLARPTVEAMVGAGWASPPGKRQFARAVCSSGPDGPVVVPVGGQGSHLVADLAHANCLAVVPEDVTRVSVGDRVSCWMLDGAPTGPPVALAVGVAAVGP